MPPTLRKLCCAACLSNIEDREFLSCTSCDKKYHLLCTNGKNLSRQEIKTWTCPDCQAAARKGGDNSATPIRPSIDAENVTLRTKHYKSHHQQEEDPPINGNEVKALTSEIRLLRQDMSTFRTEFAAVVTSLTHCQNKLEEVTLRLTNTETRLKALEENQKECAVLKATVAVLEQKLERQAQNQLKNEIEILGVDEIANENPYHLALTTAVKIGLQMVEQDLESVTRVGPRRAIDESKNKPNLPRPLVVRFTRKSLRDDFMKAAKLRRNLNSKDIAGQGPERKVFINERLTRDKRLLFREARKCASEADIKYCWIKNGSIYFRKRAGSPAKCIQSFDELHHMLPLQSGKASISE